ncbi:hypothetical protein H0G86_005333 [Trichoderma simmonsii]|uniref:Vegetative incompatibility protein HET-E-1 n=1 Tax=Trichoderma simmonsii TaxID=1491479 RepID=A0A8G0L9C3_9HYPO|nr:hypothetical protein H0G86_005333 [Trichoderma simmonsii]
MHGSLPKDICKLRNPAAKARDIAKDQVDKCISFPIQYACRYWIQHLQKSGRDWMDHGGMKNFFWTDFLGWLEVLSLLGRLSEGINMLAGLESWLHDTSRKKNFQESAQSQWDLMGWFTKNIFNHAGDNSIPQSLGMLIHDAKRFAFQHSSIIEETPLQIYCSALIFSPEQSLIRQRYHTEIPRWVIPSFRRHNAWPRYTQALWHTQPAKSLAFSPDGSYLASGYGNGTICLWDAVTGAKQRILEGHGSGVRSIDFSPKEQLIASGSGDGTIRLWNSTTGATQGILTTSNHVEKVAFSPDGASLASLSLVSSLSILSSSESFIVHMWDIASHKKQWTFESDHYSAHIAFLPDGVHIAYSSDSVTGLLDSKTGKSVCNLAEYGGVICSSRLSSGRQMVGLRAGGHIELFDVQPSVRRRWQSKTGDGLHIAFSPDDQILAANIYSESRIELLDTTSGHKIHTISCDRELTGFAFSADGTFIASTSFDKIIHFWNVSVSRQQSATDSDLLRLCKTRISDCARFVALLKEPSGRITDIYENQLFIWDAQEMKMKQNIRIKTHASSRLMTFSPSAQLIAIYWENGIVDLFKCGSGENVLTATGADYRPRFGVLRDRTFSPNGNLLALCTNFDYYTKVTNIHIWDIRRRTIAQKFQGETEWVAFSQDSKRIAYLSPNENTIYIFDLGTYDHEAQIEVDKEKLKFWSFDSNDRLVLFYLDKPSSPVQIQLRGAHTESIFRIIELNHAPSSFLFFRPVAAANAVIVKSNDRCEIWDLTTGTVMGSFENTDELTHCQLLPCRAHLRIRGAVVPVTKEDSLGCCSHRLSLEGFWIKRGNDKLMCIPPDYASALIAVRRKGVSFQAFKESSWNNFRSNSEPINTLKFDFSGIKNRYI